MRDEAFDFLTMVMVLGVALGISLNLVIPLTKEAQEVSNGELYNKLTQRKSNIQMQDGVYFEDYDGTMDYSELILTLCCQNYFMPTPRILDICGVKMEVKSGDIGMANPDGGGSVASIAEYTPKSSGTYNEIKAAVDNWAVRASGSVALTADQLKRGHFRVMMDVGKVEDSEDTPDLNDDCFAVYMLAYNRETGERKYFRCTENNLEGYMVVRDMYTLVIDP